MKAKFSELFPECMDNEFISRLEGGTIHALDIKNGGKRFVIHTEQPEYVDTDALRCSELVIREQYELSYVSIQPHFPASCFSGALLPDLIDELRRRIAAVNGSFTGCRWEYDEQSGLVTAKLAINAIPMLRAKNFEQEMSALIRERFGVETTVRLEYDEGLADCTEVKQAIEQAHSMQHDELAPVRPRLGSTGGKKDNSPPPWESNPYRRPRAEKQANNGLPTNVTLGNDIFGKSNNAPIVRISELSEEYSRVGVWGVIFAYEAKESRSGETVIVSFCVTDYTSSVTVKLLVKKSKADWLSELKVGTCVVVHGDYAFDSFEHEPVLRARHVALATRLGRCDRSEKKRVELHMHTNMSRMDAIPTAEAVVGRAVSWGHKAIAITDHGVVQSFPGAMNAELKARSKDEPDVPRIKVLYGMEAYFVNDVLDIVHGSTDMPIDGEYIVFDIETTGLSPARDRITEIGAVRVVGGEEVERFSTMVNPNMPIPAEIVALTGITDDMVREAPQEAEAVRAFLDFCGEGAVLVAHNASFDVGFINAACERLGYSFGNAYLDTLALSRVLYPELSRFKLDIVAKHLKLPEFNHHRAVDDAAILVQIFLRQCDEMQQNHGVATVSDVNIAMAGSDKKKLPSYHMIIIAKNLVGLKNLYKLVSTAHVHDFYKHPRVLKSELIAHREGLIIGSACEAGELFQAVRTGMRKSELESMARFYDFLEIQPISNNAFMVRNGSVADDNALRELNKAIVALGDRLGIPVCATCDAHYIDPEDDIFRRVLITELGMKDSFIPAKLYLRTTEEMLEEFSYLGAKKAFEVVVDNTNLIADMVEHIRPIPPGTFPPSIEGSDDNLRNITRARAREVYGDPLPEYVEERLERELNSIISNGYSVMYMTAQLLVADSVAHGYQVGSRGSVGSSFVATMAGISEVNPLLPHYVCPRCKHSEFIMDGSVGSGFDLPAKDCPECGTPMNRDGHDIPFETFLGFKGDKQPDIDLNFSNEYQSSAHRYTETLFNTDVEKVFKAGTISTVAEKTAFRYAVSYGEKQGLHLPKAEIERLKRGCTGVKSTTGQHPGGMVVVPAAYDVYDFCPIQHPANKTDTDILTTHFDFHAIHDTILKLDCLGHVGPTIYHYLEEFTGVPVTSVPMSDDKVMSLFESPEALGVTEEQIRVPTGTLSLPELGTKFVIGMLMTTKPRAFADLLQVSGLSHGTGVYLGNAKDLIDQGICTISEVIGTRDNIMTYLIGKGMDKSESFRIMEFVRKGKSKGNIEKYVPDMLEHGVPQWYIDSCFKIEYMFPKAHAAAYMISALRLGWYKVYYPVAYYAAFFTARCENFDADAAIGGVEASARLLDEISAKDKDDTSQTDEGAYAITQIILEAQARGIKFLTVDLYKSDATRFLPEDGGLRLPFVALKGLGEAAAIRLAESGKVNTYASREEIPDKAGVSRAIVEKLAAAHALDGLQESCQKSLFDGLED